MRVQSLASICIAAVLAGCASEPHPRAQQNNAAQRCRANLRQIQSVKMQWAKSENKSTNDMMTREDIMRIDRYLLNAFECPEGGTYTWGRVGEPAACSVAEHSLR